MLSLLQNQAKRAASSAWLQEVLQSQVLQSFSKEDFKKLTGQEIDSSLAPGADLPTLLGANILWAIHTNHFPIDEPITLDDINFPHVSGLPYLTALPKNVTLGRNCSVSGGHLLISQGTVTVKGHEAVAMGLNGAEFKTVFNSSDTSFAELTVTTPYDETTHINAFNASLDKLDNKLTDPKIKNYELSLMYAANNDPTQRQLNELLTRAYKDPNAAYQLGDVYFTRKYDAGLNKQLAADWYQKAARAGNAHAAFRLGTMYLQGDGISKNEQLGAQYLAVAYCLAPQHKESILPMLQPLAEEKKTDITLFAIKLFGETLRQGTLVDDRGLLRKQHLQQLAALTPCSERDRQLAMLYLEGTVVAKDVKKADEYLRSALQSRDQAKSLDLTEIYRRRVAGQPLDFKTFNTFRSYADQLNQTSIRGFGFALTTLRNFVQELLKNDPGNDPFQSGLSLHCFKLAYQNLNADDLYQEAMKCLTPGTRNAQQERIAIHYLRLYADKLGLDTVLTKLEAEPVDQDGSVSYLLGQSYWTTGFISGDRRENWNHTVNICFKNALDCFKAGAEKNKEAAFMLAGIYQEKFQLTLGGVFDGTRTYLENFQVSFYQYDNSKNKQDRESEVICFLEKANDNGHADAAPELAKLWEEKSRRWGTANKQEARVNALKWRKAGKEDFEELPGLRDVSGYNIL